MHKTETALKKKIIFLRNFDTQTNPSIQTRKPDQSLKLKIKGWRNNENLAQELKNL